jgi:carbon-monoxide dehydrogenase small subunit
MSSEPRTRTVELTVNGEPVEQSVEPMESLQSVLRERLGRTDTKIGCEQGGCGSCTVLVDGEPVVSCLLPVEQVRGQEVTTVEGLADNGQLHPLQEAFFDNFAAQCGYCTPGMIMTSKALLDRNPDPSEAEITDALSGNLCRCTGYEPIIEAVEVAAAEMDGGNEGGD